MTDESSTYAAAVRALTHFELAGPPSDGPPLLRKIDTGLINRSFEVSRGTNRWILQRLNPIFSREIHSNIAAVSAHLHRHNLNSTALIPSQHGKLEVDLEEDGVWRLLTYISGETHDTLRSETMAESAARLLASWHRVGESVQHEFVHPRRAHDPSRHLKTLQDSLAACREHRAFARISALSSQIIAQIADLAPLPELPRKMVHGDPKLNNLRFEGHEAVALIDLDTVGPGYLGFEIGDALRSWCNTSAEDDPHASFSQDYFSAVVNGYRQGWQSGLSPDEEQAFVLGVEWIALELAMRFANDALRESYFAWDPQRYSSATEHNLARATAQLNLARSAKSQRQDRVDRLRR
jgi:Ser/Thr protein kinase RdoA (MazF antagonist)